MNKKPKTRKTKPGAPVGSVLVIGGGVGGIQASLDLANSGFRVHLVESSPAIGGSMAQLDKTFPTNDCSMCILSPKMVEAGRHLNIHLATLGEMCSLEGRAGRFKARIRHRARYVDPAKCTGCGDCLEHCPTRFQPDYTLQRRPVPISEADRALIEKITADCGAERPALLYAMQSVQDEQGYLSRSMVYGLAEAFRVPASLIYRMGTFDAAFSFTPPGSHILRVCTGTACRVRGADTLLEELHRELGLSPGESTDDERFRLETVRCLGCCNLAPAIQIDNRIYGPVQPGEMSTILKEYSA